MNNVRPAMVLTFVVSLIGVGNPLYLGAQERYCLDKENSLKCFNRALNEALKVDEKMKTESTTRLDNTAQDRVTTAMGGGNVSAVQNFLPAFVASLGFESVEEENGDLRLTYNFGRNGLPAFSLEAIVHEPEIFEPLLNSFAEGNRDDLKQDLSGAFADFDDFEAQFTVGIKINSGGWRVGRDLGQYSQARDTLFQETKGLLGQKDNQAERERVRASLSSFAPNEPPSDELNVAMAGVARAAANRHTALAKLMETKGYYRLADLIANQPQISLTASLRDRTDLTGPDEWSLKFSTELTRGNLNGLARSCGAYDKINLKCYQGFLKKKDAAIRHGWRFTLNAEYGETDAFAPEIPDVETNFQLAETSRWIAGLTLGRALKVNEKTEVSRFDLEAKYEDVTGDPMRQGRFVSTATLTQRINDDVGVSTSLVYANRPEYRGEVDEEFSLRAGLRFKVNRKSK